MTVQRRACPHCEDPDLEPDEHGGITSCPSCMRLSVRCPRCDAVLRIFDYWRRPGILPPLPRKQPITFAVEEDPRRGPFATFDEGGHRYRFWSREARVDVEACDAS